MMGHIGTGKTTLAEALGTRLGMEVISSDLLRKRLAGLNPYQPQRDDFDQGLYTPEMTDLVYETMVRKARPILKEGKGVILDATFSQKRWRALARGLAEEMDIPFLMVLATAPPHVVRERLQARAKERVVSNGRWEIYLRHRERFQEPTEEEGPIVLVDTRQRVETLIERVREAINAL